MVKKITLITTLVLSCLVGTLAHAQGMPPPNVSNVTAAFVNGQLTVSWSPVADPSGIDYYRIYFSRQSILGNQGNYDDFERTNGDAASYTFMKLPYQGRKLFFSVMAVNKQGVESESFFSEASADIPAAGETQSLPPVVSSSVSMPVSSSSASLAPEPLSLMRIRAYSSTGILLEFSKDLNLSAPVDTGSFLIVDASGAQLKVSEVAFSGSSMLTLKTDMQQPERVYVVGVMKNISAADGSSMTIPLPQMSFFGFRALPQIPSSVSFSIPASSSSMSSSAPPVPQDTTPPEDARDLALYPAAQAGGTYDVNVAWQASLNTAGDLSSYVAYTTVDGVHFSPGQPLSPTDTQFHIAQVKPGTFGVKITTKDFAGNESRGVQKIVTLPHTGVGLLGIFAISGAIAGRRVKKRRE